MNPLSTQPLKRLAGPAPMLLVMSLALWVSPVRSQEHANHVPQSDGEEEPHLRVTQFTTNHARLPARPGHRHHHPGHHRRRPGAPERKRL